MCGLTRGSPTCRVHWQSVSYVPQTRRRRDAPKEYHGHTAGTIAARAVGTTRFGVAPEAGLASAMVIEGGNVIARILAGMDWTVGQGVQILSMSLGLRGYTPAFLSVGACDARDSVADFSGSQLFARTDNPIVPDLVAPRVDVLSCVPGGRCAAMSGSSMATPHIAGLAALLMHASKASANRLRPSPVALTEEIDSRHDRGTLADVVNDLRRKRGAHGVQHRQHINDFLRNSARDRRQVSSCREGHADNAQCHSAQCTL